MTLPTSCDKLLTSPDNSQQLPTNSERSLKSGISLDGIATLLCKFLAGVSHSRVFVECPRMSGFRYSDLALGTELGHTDRLTVDISMHIEVSM